MEWLRSCYVGQWKLFKNHPGLTEGRYFFAKPGAQFYPGLHNLWSANWTNDERIPLPQLGEMTTGARAWFRGSPPTPYPGEILVGDENCIENGELFPLQMISRSFIGGIDSRCFPNGAYSEVCSCSQVMGAPFPNFPLSANPCSCSQVTTVQAAAVVIASMACSCSQVTTAQKAHVVIDSAACSCSQVTTAAAAAVVIDSAACSCSQVTTAAAAAVVIDSAACSCSRVTTAAAAAVVLDSAACSCSQVTTTQIASANFYFSRPCGCSRVGVASPWPVSAICVCSAVGPGIPRPVSSPCSCSRVSS